MVGSTGNTAVVSASYSYDNPGPGILIRWQTRTLFFLGIDVLGCGGDLQQRLDFRLAQGLLILTLLQSGLESYSEQPEFQVGRVQADKILGIESSFGYKRDFTGTIEDLVERSVVLFHLCSGAKRNSN
jgi:hypothetical protein